MSSNLESPSSSSHVSDTEESVEVTSSTDGIELISPSAETLESSIEEEHPGLDVTRIPEEVREYLETNKNKFNNLDFQWLGLASPEVWREIASYSDYKTQKSLRIVHPIVYNAFKGFKQFHDNTIIRFKNQKPSVFETLATTVYCWGEIGIEFANSTFKETFPKDFFAKYADRFTSLAFYNCTVDLKSYLGEDKDENKTSATDNNSEGKIVAPTRKNFLDSVLDQCPRLLSLTMRGCINFLTEDGEVFSENIPWPSIKILSLGRTEKFSDFAVCYILNRVEKLKELSIIGPRSSAPGTKKLAKNITEEQRTAWDADAAFILNVVLPLLVPMRNTLTKLDLSYHYLLANNAGFITRLISIFGNGHGNLNIIDQRLKPRLHQLDLSMCQITPVQFARIMEEITSLIEFSCCLSPVRKCKHPGEEVLKVEDWDDSNAGNSVNKSSTLLKDLLPRTLTGKLEYLKISNSSSLDCLCFISEMKNLLHLDASYCPFVRSKKVLLNGNGPAFYPVYMKKEKEKNIKRLERRELKRAEEGKQPIVPKILPICWKLKTFLFAGNKLAKLNIQRYMFYNLTHLDLSFSDCVHDNKDFHHICKFRKLEILKLSGSTGTFRLYPLRRLTCLTELRLRSCRNIKSEQFEHLVALHRLVTLDIADTQVAIEGFKKIVTLNRQLTFLDVRDCENIKVECYQEFYDSIHGISMHKGILFPRKRRNGTGPTVDMSPLKKLELGDDHNEGGESGELVEPPESARTPATAPNKPADDGEIEEPEPAFNFFYDSFGHWDPLGGEDQ